MKKQKKYINKKKISLIQITLSNELPDFNASFINAAVLSSSVDVKIFGSTDIAFICLTLAQAPTESQISTITS